MRRMIVAKERTQMIVAKERTQIVSHRVLSVVYAMPGLCYTWLLSYDLRCYGCISSDATDVISLISSQ